MYVPDQPRTSSRLLGVSIDHHSGDDLFEPLQLRYESLDLLPDIFEFLSIFILVMRDGRQSLLGDTSECLMSAFTPPRAALRGGNQSADSFAISRRISAQPMTLCFFAGKSKIINMLTVQTRMDELTTPDIMIVPRGAENRWTSLSEHGFALGSGCRLKRDGRSFSEY